MTVSGPLAITPLTDLTTWLRGRGLEAEGGDSPAEAASTRSVHDRRQ